MEEPKPEDQVSSEPEYVVSRISGTYHLLTCPIIENLVDYEIVNASEEELWIRGYEPCHVCHP